MNSEMAILQGRDLAKATLIDIGLKNIYPFLAYGKTPVADNATFFSRPLEKAINIFLSSFRMKAIEKSTIFKIDFFHTNPDVATSSLNKFVDNYLIHHLNIYQEPEQLIFFKTQVSKYKKFLNKSETALFNYKQTNNILYIQQQQIELLRQISRFKAKIADNVVDRSQKEELLTRLREQELSGESSEINIDAITSIRGKVNNLKLEEHELLGRYTPDNPKIINIRNEITAAEELIKEEELIYFGKKQKRVQEDLLALNSEINAQNAYMNIHLNDLNKLNKAEIQLKELDRKVDLDEANYELYVSRMEEARISKEMDDQKLANVRIVDRASRPIKPQSSNKTLSMLLSIIVGLFLGCSIAIVIEFNSHNFNNREDIINKLQIKALASIPELKEKGFSLN